MVPNSQSRNLRLQSLETSTSMTRLTRDYFNQDTLSVAKDLIGKEFFINSHRGIITETEAYIGKDDPACHAARGKTPRTQVMF